MISTRFTKFFDRNCRYEFTDLCHSVPTISFSLLFFLLPSPLSTSPIHIPPPSSTPVTPPPLSTVYSFTRYSSRYISTIIQTKSVFLNRDKRKNYGANSTHANYFTYFCPIFIAVSFAKNQTAAKQQTSIFTLAHG